MGYFSAPDILNLLIMCWGLSETTAPWFAQAHRKIICKCSTTQEASHCTLWTAREHSGETIAADTEAADRSSIVAGSDKVKGLQELCTVISPQADNSNLHLTLCSSAASLIKHECCWPGLENTPLLEDRNTVCTWTTHIQTGVCTVRELMQACLHVGVR